MTTSFRLLVFSLGILERMLWIKKVYDLALCLVFDTQTFLDYFDVRIKLVLE